MVTGTAVSNVQVLVDHGLSDGLHQITGSVGPGDRSMVHKFHSDPSNFLADRKVMRWLVVAVSL